MRDLIAKQTASLERSGGGMALYNPSRLRSPEYEQEVLDAQPSNGNEEVVKLLKDIASVLKKSLMVQEDIESNTLKMLKSPRANSSTIDQNDSPSIRPAQRSLKGAIRIASTMAGASKATAMRAPLALAAPEKTAEAVKTEIKKEENTEQAKVEEAKENTLLQQKQIELLEGILGALTGKQPTTKKEEPAAESSNSGGMDLKGMMKGGLKGILKGLLKVGIIGLVSSAVNGLVDAFKEFSSSGSILKALIAGVGGFLDMLTFGLINKETIQGVVDFMTDAWKNISKYVDDYLIKPISGFVDSVGKMFDEYVVQPMTSFATMISTAFNEYIATPVKSFFDNLVNAFKAIPDSISAFISNLEIPKIGITVFGKEISAGPWKPFAGSTSNTSSSSSSASSSSVSNTTNNTASAVTNAPSSSTMAGNVSNNSNVTNVAPTNQAGNVVYNTSQTNSSMKEENKSTSSAPVIVSAPTNVNNQSKQSVIMQAPIRNPDQGFNSYIARNRIA